MEYAEAFVELLEIFDYFSEEDYNKIPKNLINTYEENKSSDYTFEYTPTKALTEQNVSKLTQIILSNIYINYIADDDEKFQLKKMDYEELLKENELKREKYDPNDIFKNRKASTKDITNESNLSLTTYKEKNIFKKIVNKILNLLKKS